MSCAFPAAAVLVRADRDDAEYLELATRYPSSVALNASGAEGVLIAPRWLLTSARNARSLQRRVTIAGRAHDIQSTFLHPDARAGTASDFALLRIAEPVRGIEPTPLYRAADEAGKALIFVAHGPTGRIGEAARTADGRARAGINTVERVSAQALGVQIKPPDEASDLQGALIPGEEGAAAFLEVEGKAFVAGLYHGDATGWNQFTRLSAFVPWIEATMTASERDEAEKLLEDRPR